MKIAFNIDYDHLKYTGIGRYGIELVSSFMEMGEDCELWMWRNTRKTPPLIKNTEGRIKLYPFPKRINDFYLPSLRALRSGIDWLHSANGELLPSTPFLKQITMVHDLGPFMYGHMKPENITRVTRKRIQRIAKKADCIVVNSESTREDLLNFFPGLEQRVFLTPLGIDHFSSEKSPSAVKEHILNVGTVEPRKNIDGLLKAYSILRGRENIPPLIIAGQDGFRADEYKQLAVDLKIADKVTFTGFVSGSELIELYSKAFCLAHPAHHEGFGFTVPEAFTWGLPVIASNTGGLGEFFSETAWMVDPDDPESIANGISLALKTGVTAEQQAKRTEIAGTLTWKNCAEKTLSAMKTIDG